MPKPRTSTNLELARKVNRQAGRDAYVTDLRDGRKPMRPTTIPSGTTYRRKAKHGGWS